MTTEMKPLEWIRAEGCWIEVSVCDTCKIGYIALTTSAQWFLVEGPLVVYQLPGPYDGTIEGPYDGTIETAKKRCEEHRRKSIPPIGFDASFNGVPFNWDTREGGENP